MRALIEALAKSGIPARLTTDDGRQAVRASHPRIPVSTTLVAEVYEGRPWLLNEWGAPLCPAGDTSTAVAYVSRLLDQHVR
ncbi:hypothetical protein J4573_25550 [Actinomadura barringtoniae]|uniref:Uncharacterized protein n=1 Tax=Actinomadura barringtoniae TaxID=1427535 RepID=A0A939PDT9_9ACTN|nr:hypothetical protein [Actinomadura barringtoniae]MBO2450493.1 hypothetical protein [Actinomadura barringtoniae]